MPKALKSCPKSKKSPDLVTLLASIKAIKVIEPGALSLERAEAEDEFVTEKNKMFHENSLLGFIPGNGGSCDSRLKEIERSVRER